jgi:hypothetical protein
VFFIPLCAKRILLVPRFSVLNSFKETLLTSLLSVQINSTTKTSTKTTTTATTVAATIEIPLTSSSVATSSASSTSLSGLQVAVFVLGSLLGVGLILSGLGWIRHVRARRYTVMANDVLSYSQSEGEELATTL